MYYAGFCCGLFGGYCRRLCLLLLFRRAKTDTIITLLLLRFGVAYELRELGSGLAVYLALAVVYFAYKLRDVNSRVCCVLPYSLILPGIAVYFIDYASAST